MRPTKRDGRNANALQDAVEICEVGIIVAGRNIRVPSIESTGVLVKWSIAWLKRRRDMAKEKQSMTDPSHSFEPIPCGRCENLPCEDHERGHA